MALYLPKRSAAFIKGKCSCFGRSWAWQRKNFIESREPDQLPEQVTEYDAEREEKLGQLYMAIEKLNQVEKAIVMLYMEDRTYEEMEEILGINQGNLRVKMNRIKDKLRQLTKNI